MKLSWPWRRAQMHCREAVALVTDYLEGALPADKRELLERHLAECADCSTYFDQIRMTIDALGSVDVDALSPRARDALVALFRSYQAER